MASEYDLNEPVGIRVWVPEYGFIESIEPTHDRRAAYPFRVTFTDDIYKAKIWTKVGFRYHMVYLGGIAFPTVSFQYKDYDE